MIPYIICGIVCLLMFHLNMASSGLFPTTQRLWLLESIKDKLSIGNMGILKGSPVSHLFDIPYIKKQDGLLGCMLTRLRPFSATQEKLTFRISNQTLHFTWEDFAVVTGLRYGTVPQLDDTVSAVHRNVFFKKTKNP